MVKFNIRKMRFDKKIFIQSVRIGLPTGLQQSFVALGMLALNAVINPFGTNVIAAYTVAGRVETFATMPAMNFGMAFVAFVGQNLGANKIDRIYRGLRATIIMTSAISIFFALINIFLGKYMLTIFTNDSEVIALGAEYLVITASFYICFSMMQCYTSIMRGAGDTLVPMFITLTSLWLIRLPLSIWLSQHFGVDGIWWSIPIGWACGMIGSYIYYKTGRWKNKAVVDVKF